MIPAPFFATISEATSCSWIPPEATAPQADCLNPSAKGCLVDKRNAKQSKAQQCETKRCKAKKATQRRHCRLTQSDGTEEDCEVQRCKAKQNNVRAQQCNALPFFVTQSDAKWCIGMQRLYPTPFETSDVPSTAPSQFSWKTRQIQHLSLVGCIQSLRLKLFSAN